MDVSDIRAEVKRQVNEPTGTDEGFWEDSEYLSCINSGIADIARRLRCCLTCATFTTDGTTIQWDISEDSLDDIFEIKQVNFYASTYTYDPLISVTRDELDDIRAGYVGTSTGYPVCFCYEDRAIEFEVIPVTGKTVKVFYYYAPAALTDDSDVPDLRYSLHPLIVSYVSWKFCESEDSRHDKLLYFKSEFMENVLKGLNEVQPPASSYTGIKDETEIPYV